MEPLRTATREKSREVGIATTSWSQVLASLTSSRQALETPVPGLLVSPFDLKLGRALGG